MDIFIIWQVYGHPVISPAENDHVHKNPLRQAQGICFFTSKGGGKRYFPTKKM